MLPSPRQANLGARMLRLRLGALDRFDPPFWTAALSAKISILAKSETHFGQPKVQVFNGKNGHKVTKMSSI